MPPLRWRHALPAMSSAFVCEQGLGLRPLDPEHNHAGTLFEEVEAKAPSAAQTRRMSEESL